MLITYSSFSNFSSNTEVFFGPVLSCLPCRHGESLNNLYGRIGGDASLSPRGEKYARALAAFVASLGQAPEVSLLTSFRAFPRV